MNVNPQCQSCPEVKIEVKAESNDCCSNQTGKKPVPAYVKAIELICRIAIAVFALVVQPVLFAISFGIGSAVGAAYAIYLKIKNDPNSLEGDAQPVCAQGFMEYLSGMKYPLGISTAVTGIFIAEHVYHNPCFYVPFAGFFVGLWAGKEATLGACTLAGHAASWFDSKGEPKQKPSCCHAV